MQERFDLVDKNGNPLGKSKPRSEVHRDGDWHKAVNVWIINSKNEVLLQKRSAEKESYPNFWDLSCAGHVDAGEMPKETAVRELQEELGITATPDQLEYIFAVSEEHFLNQGTYIDREIREIFLLRLDISDFQLQEEEVAEVKWVALDDFEKMTQQMPPDLVPHDKEYQQAFDLLRKKLNS